jgi:hypothetical protein
MNQAKDVYSLYDVKNSLKSSVDMLIKQQKLAQILAGVGNFPPLQNVLIVSGARSAPCS